MGRPLRRHEPGQLYLVTTRCHQARFFLRPDRELNEAVLEWLARAQQHFPRLQILALCVLSNHLHLVVRDEDGELAAWVDGELYMHFEGLRWRTDERVKIKRFSLGIYIHEARRENVVWYDDVALSTGYIGPLDATGSEK